MCVGGGGGGGGREGVVGWSNDAGYASSAEASLD